MINIAHIPKELTIGESGTAKGKPAEDEAERAVPPLSSGDRILIFPGIIDPCRRIAAVDWPVRPLKFAIAKGP
jgi:hypothetical protein